MRRSADRCQQAMAEAGDDVLLQARCHATLAETSPSGAAADLCHAERAVELLETLDAPPADLLANALTNVASPRMPARPWAGRLDAGAGRCVAGGLAPTSRSMIGRLWASACI